MDKEKIVDYLDKQFWKHKVYECMTENETGYEYVPRDALSKIVDGLIPMIKTELKNCSMPDVSGRSEQLLEEQINWLMANTSLEVEKIVDFKEHFK
jgi:hypothetical protein